MKKKILATALWIALIGAMCLITYIFSYYPKQSLIILLIVAGIFVLVWLWILIYNAIK